MIESNAESHEPDQVATPTTEDSDALANVMIEKATAIASLLSPADQARMMVLFPKLMAHKSNPALLAIANELVPLSAAQAAAWVHSHIDDLERRFGS